MEQIGKTLLKDAASFGSASACTTTHEVQLTAREVSHLTERQDFSTKIGIERPWLNNNNNFNKVEIFRQLEKRESPQTCWTGKVAAMNFPGEMFKCFVFGAEEARLRGLTSPDGRRTLKRSPTHQPARRLKRFSSRTKAPTSPRLCPSRCLRKQNMVSRLARGGRKHSTQHCFHAFKTHE